MRRLVLLGALACAAAACGGGDSPSPAASPASAPAAEGFELTSPALQDGGTVAARYTCDGEDVSPELSWTGVPGEAQELALVVDDPDAPSGLFTHWLVYGVTPDSTGLPEGVPKGAELDDPGPLLQGKNDAGELGYSGPCPPSGEHHYVFQLLALDAEVELAPGADRGAFDEAIAGHVVAKARLTATYERP